MTVSRKTRVLYIGHPYILAINRSVARELARDPSFEVVVAAPKTFRGDLRPLTLEPEPPGSPLRVVGLDAYGSRFIHVFRFAGRMLRELLREGMFDIVHAMAEPYIYVGWQIAQAARVSGAKFYFYTEQNLHKTYPPPFGFFEKQCVACAEGWLACGQLVFDVLVRRGYPADKGKIVPLAVDTSAFQPPTLAAKAEVLAELGLDGPVVGFVGRLVPSKGTAVLLGALERLPADQGWSLLCLGSGPEEATILRWARQHGWQDRVRVKLVRHDEVPRHLRAVDLLAAPSQTTPKWKEQFGRMIVEAFASGVPVIGSDSGEIPYVIGRAGCVVPEADIGAWAGAIGTLLAGNEQRGEFAALGLERAHLYSARSIAGTYREIFRRVEPDGVR